MDISVEFLLLAWEHRLGNLVLQTKSEIKNVGGILDCDPTFKLHTDNFVKPAFFYLRNKARVKPFLNLNDFLFSHKRQITTCLKCSSRSTCMH